MATQNLNKVSERAKELTTMIPTAKMSVSKLGAVLGCADSYFRTATGINPSPVIVNRIKTLFPNVNAQWLLCGEGDMLTYGDAPIAPLDILRLSTPTILKIMRAIYDGNKSLAEKLLLENDINPNDLYARYPELFSIFRQANDGESIKCEAHDDLVAENRHLRKELEIALFKLHSIELILTSGAAKIAPKEGKNQ